MGAALFQLTDLDSGKTPDQIWSGNIEDIAGSNSDLTNALSKVFIDNEAYWEIIDQTLVGQLIEADGDTIKSMNILQRKKWSFVALTKPEGSKNKKISIVAPTKSQRREVKLWIDLP